MRRNKRESKETGVPLPKLKTNDVIVLQKRG